MIKIGELARDLGLSVQTIRLYEAEGLLISFKSRKGTRWYSPRDIEWIRRIHELVGEGLTFAGIRRLLALLPCWALRPCRPEDHAECSMRFELRMPCWIAPEKLCTEQLKECYHCNAYRRAREMVDLKLHADIVPLTKESGADQQG
jgi:MerR family transcriptional regulator/heat shock protein HspR